MKRIFCFLIMNVICIYFSNAQELIREKINKHAPEMVYIPGDAKNDPFYISRYEVRNKDYITYLSWLERVYPDYPEIYQDALPASIKAEDYPEYLSGLYSYYRDNPEYFGESLPDTFRMHDYLFNPAFRNFPVLGLSAMQASRYCQWLSDRFNEYLLIQYDLAVENTNQRNAASFDYESFMMGQYQVIIRSLIPHPTGGRDVNWYDKMLAPSFRLPDKAEWEKANSLNHEKNQLDFKNLKCKRPFGKDHFMDHFYKHYVENDYDREFNKWSFYQQESQANKYRENIFPICKKFNKPLMGFNNEVGEWVAETYENEEIYHCINLTEAKKDSLGIFPYIHLQDDKTGGPLFVNKEFPGTKFNLTGNNTKVKGFRIAMSAYHINRQQSFNSIKEAKANPEIVLMLVLFNYREDLPEDFGVFPSLRYLFIPAYKLNSFPTGITKLRKMLHLTITKNELVKIPEPIKNLKSLVHLDLSGNEIDQIPVQIAELSHLTHLNLSNNNLTRPGSEIMKLKNLKYLNLKGNNLLESEKEKIRKWFYSGRGIDKSDSDYMLVL